MKAQFDHSLLSSFYLWFEHELLDSEAYVTGVQNQFKNISITGIPSNYVCYQGAYRQLVADNSINAPNTGFFVNGSFTPIDSPNFWVDYENGRIFLPKASGQSLSITGENSIKEVNTYISNDDDVHLIMHGDFKEEGVSTPYWFSKDDKLDEKTYFLPACFISIGDSSNSEFSFGGEELTNTRARVLVLAKDNYLLDAILSKFRDSARKCFKLISFDDFPYGGFGSLKSHPYSYVDFSLQNGEKDVIIDKVNVSKLRSSEIQAKINKSFSIGFIDFDLQTSRFPRI